MNRFFLIVNREKDPDLTLSGEIVRAFEAQDCICILGEPRYDARCGRTEGYTDPGQIPADTECIVSLGGDGTLIQSFRDTRDLNLPIIGINFGTLGYLAELEPGRIGEAVRALKSDDYTIENRMLIEGRVERPEGSASSFALNDIVVTRHGPLRVITFNIRVNSMPFVSVKADGIIVSTPTGSTGYNLSAGGPIVEPSARMIVITPICAHTLKMRSIVLSEYDVVEIEPAYQGVEGDIEVNYDGRRIISAGLGERIVIKSSDSVMKMIRISTDSFMQVLHKKMDD